MKPGWVIGLLILFIGLQIIMGICEMSYTTDVPAVYDAFMGGGSWSASRVNNALNGMWDTFMFDYPFFTGAWLMLRYTFMAVSAGVVLVLFWTQPLATLIGAGMLTLATLVTGGF